MGYIIVIILILIILIAINHNKNNSKRLESLKQAYKQSLRGSDKRAALEAGRAYYSSLRKGQTLTIYDEQAITNDLSTMNGHTSNIHQLSSSKL